MKIKGIIVFIIILIFSLGQAICQQKDSSFSANSNNSNVNKQITNSSNLENTKEMELTKSPTAAVFWSLAFPGAGQIYVESYWKAPIFALGAAACIYFAIDNNRKYVTYQDEYDRLDPKTTNYEINKKILGLKKEFYRDNRDKSFFYLAGVYILAAIDAYVGAHLYDYTVSDDLKINFIPIHNGVILKMNVIF